MIAVGRKLVVRGGLKQRIVVEGEYRQYAQS